MKRVIWMDIGLEYKILETAMYSKSRKTNFASILMSQDFP